MSYLYMDTETTDLERKEIIQFASICKNKIINKLYKPVGKISAKAMKVHHMTPELLADKDAIDVEALQEIVDKCNHLVAYNSGFDVSALRKAGVVIDDEKIIDVFSIMMFMEDEFNLDFEELSLQYLIYELKLYKHRAKVRKKLELHHIHNAHDALSDVVDLILLCKWIEAKSGEKLVDLHHLHETAILQRVPIGFSKGTPFNELNNGGIKWLKSLEHTADILERSISYYFD